jgi:uncharacterized protein (TIGR03435 family)
MCVKQVMESRPDASFARRFLVSLAVAMTVANAQNTPASRPGFEVSSIKRSPPGDGGMMLEYLPGGRLSVKNCPLYTLIAESYFLNIRSPRLAGGPDWIQTEKYDIEAKAPAGALDGLPLDKPLYDKFRLMIESLLADRFRLSINHTPTMMPVYALVVAKEGLKLPRTKTSEGHTPCHCLSGSPNGLRGEGFNISNLVLLAEYWTRRAVIDETNIQGDYDLPQKIGGFVDPQLQASPAASASTDLPTFFELYQQFGLRLEPRRAVVDVLVIDHIERPSEN